MERGKSITRTYWESPMIQSLTTWTFIWQKHLKSMGTPQWILPNILKLQSVIKSSQGKQQIRFASLTNAVTAYTVFDTVMYK